MFLALWIINKAGGLIFQRDFASDQQLLTKVSTNDYLVLAGTFHSVHAIAARISPLQGSSGITSLETDTFTLTCHQTHTGTKFIVFTDPYHQNIDQLVRKVYDLYADYVMKNPFFTPEMPVRCEQFDVHLAKLARSMNG